jgi:glycosyltransferase involved in cell wall biosynthesis
MKIGCSVPVLTLNARLHLEHFLPTLVENVEDVFIIDGNSTDGTQEYARRLGVRVERQVETEEPNQKITDFRLMRLKTWEMCRYDWLLILDADEILTPALMRLIEKIVVQNDKKQVHLVRRHIQLPDGTIVENSPFYSAHYVRLFARSAGVTLADRKVHERFIIPPNCTSVKHEEAIICPESDPASIRKRSLQYVQLEAQSLTDASWRNLWRWIIWYNIKSFFGQFFKVVIVEIESRLHGIKTLPWSYNIVFFEYRFFNMFVNVLAWIRLRKHQGG